MKKICLLILISIFPLMLSGQYWGGWDGTRVDSSFSYRWDPEANDWVYDEREIHIYDSNGWEIEFYRYSWNSDLNVWEPGDYWINVYDTEGRHVERRLRETDEEDNHVYYERWVRIFDSVGNISKFTSYDWDEHSNDWVLAERRISVYDIDGNFEENVIFHWDKQLNDWVLAERRVPVNEENGQKWGYTNYYWDNDSLDWIENEHNLSWSYDSSGYLVTGDLFLNLDPAKDRWSGQRSISVYDSNWHQREYAEYSWVSDSGFWAGVYRKVWDYDSNGNEIEYTRYTWDTDSGIWVGNYSEVRVYDSSGHQTEYALYSWNSDSGFLACIYRQISVLDSNGRETEYARYSRDYDSTALAGLDRHTRIYDSLGNQTEFIRYSWDYDSGFWANNYHEVWVFDSVGHKKEYNKYLWDSDSAIWVGDDHRTWIYDSLGNRIEYTRYSWDSDSSEWIGDSRWTYAYDSMGQQIENISYSWDSDSSMWIAHERDAYAYDSMGHEIEFASYKWDHDSNIWLGSWRYVRVYDSRGFETLVEEYLWDSESHAWEANWRKIYIYDSSGNLTETQYYRFGPDYNASIIDTRQVWVYDSEGRVTEYTRHYDWNVVSGIGRGWERWIRVYDSAGHETKYVRYSWVKGEWFEEESTEWVYDSNGNLLEYVYINWHDYRENYVGERFIYTFDSLGRQTSVYIYSWSVEDSNWTLQSVHKQSYDIWGNIIESIHLENVFSRCECPDDRLEQYFYDAAGNYIGEAHYKLDLESGQWIGVGKWIEYKSYKYYLAKDLVFYVDENTGYGTSIGTVPVGYNYTGEDVRFTLLDGHSSHLFSIDSISGEIRLTPSVSLDYEEYSSHQLFYQASVMDYGELITEEASILIFVRDVDEAPEVNDTVFEVFENSSSGTIIGSLSAYDPDSHPVPLTFNIESGNEDNAFTINRLSGVLSVTYDSALDFESKSLYTLSIQVSDGALSSHATVTVRIMDIVTSDGFEEPNKQVKVYPNPALDFLYIEIPHTSEDIDIRIYNSMGQMILIRTGNPGEFDVKDFRAGMYYVRISIGKNQIVKKVFIQ